jgi:hypothetical protein
MLARVGVAEHHVRRPAARYFPAACIRRRSMAREKPGTIHLAPVYVSSGMEGPMWHLNRERLTRGVVGAMLTMVLCTTVRFGLARHFAG